MQDKNKRKKVRRGSMVILVFMLVYIPSVMHWVYGKNISTEIIRIGYLEDSVNANGYILRDSVLYKSPYDGKYIPEVLEGERVPANFRIATILNKSSVKLLELLEEKNLKIIKAQNERSETQSIFSEDIKKIENEIGKKVKLIIEDSNMNRLSGTVRLEEEISDLIQKKAGIVGGTATSDTYINSLKKEKEILQGQVDSNTKDIFSESPGVVSYVVDEYEEVLNPSALEELTPKFLESIKGEQPVINAKDKDVACEKPFVKIINGSEFYIAALLEEKDAAQFKVDDTIKLRINDLGVETDCKVGFKSEKIDGKYIIAVKVNRFISETSALRKINIDLIRNSHKGLKVPLKSLRNFNSEEMKAKIVLVKANCASVCDVKIEGKDNEFAVISSLDGGYSKGVSLYDTYIINPENVEEGQIIRK